jgi:hypothetical protein
VKPSSTVLVRTRLAKSYSRLLHAEVAYFRTKRCTLAGPSAANKVLPAQQKCPLAPFQPSPLAANQHSQSKSRALATRDILVGTVLGAIRNFPLE